MRRKRNGYYRLCNSNRGTFYFSPECIAEEIDKHAMKFYKGLFSKRQYYIPIQNIYRSYITYKLYENKDDFIYLIKEYKSDILKYLCGWIYNELQRNNIFIEFTDTHVICYREIFNSESCVAGREFLWDLDLNQEYELYDSVNNLF